MTRRGGALLVLESPVYARREDGEADVRTAHAPAEAALRSRPPAGAPARLPGPRRAPGRSSPRPAIDLETAAARPGCERGSSTSRPCSSGVAACPRVPSCSRGAMAEAIAHYAGHVVASVLLARLTRGVAATRLRRPPRSRAGARPRAAGGPPPSSSAGSFGPPLRGSLRGASGSTGMVATSRRRAGTSRKSWRRVRPSSFGWRGSRAASEARRPSSGPGFSWRVAGVLGLLVPSVRTARTGPRPIPSLRRPVRRRERGAPLPPLPRGGREVLLVGTRRAS